MRLEANQEEYKRLIDEDEKKKRKLYPAYQRRGELQKLSHALWDSLTEHGDGNQQKMARYMTKETDRRAALSFTDWYALQKTPESANLNNFLEYAKQLGLTLEDLANSGDGAVDSTNEFANTIKNAGNTTTDMVSKVKALKTELKELRKRDPQNDAEYTEIERRKAEIQKQLKALKPGANSKSKHERGTYLEDSIDEITAPIDDAHQKKLLEINKFNGNISKTELAIEKNRELIRYCGELQTALNKMLGETDSTHAQTIDKI